MKSYLQNNYKQDNVGSKFQAILNEDNKNRNVNTLYKLKSKFFIG